MLLLSVGSNDFLSLETLGVAKRCAVGIGQLMNTALYSAKNNIPKPIFRVCMKNIRSFYSVFMGSIAYTSNC